MSWMVRNAPWSGSAIRRFLMGAMLVFTAAPVHAGLIIRPTFGTSITSNPNSAKIQSTINQVIALYSSKFTDNITVNITFQNITSGLGQSSKPIYYVPTSTYLSALRADSTTTNDKTALSKLPASSTDPVKGLSTMFVGQANLKALGFSVGSGSDGTIGLNTSLMNLTRTAISASKYDLYAVVAHEIDEILGLGSGLQLPAQYGGYIMPQDLFRYSSVNGQRSYTTSSTALSYFSIDGINRLVRFNQNAGGDLGDWYSTGPHTPRVQDAYATPGVIINPSSVEYTALDVIGYNLSSAAIASSQGGAAFAGSASSFALVPEPSVMMLTLLGLLGFGGSALRKRRCVPTSAPQEN